MIRLLKESLISMIAIKNMTYSAKSYLSSNNNTRGCQFISRREPVLPSVRERRLFPSEKRVDPFFPTLKQFAEFHPTGKKQFAEFHQTGKSITLVNELLGVTGLSPTNPLITQVKKLFGVTTTYIDIPDSFLFPSPPRTSPDRDLGNLISLSAQEEKFDDANDYFLSSTAPSDLLQLIMPSLSIGCLYILYNNPALAHISLPDFISHLYSLLPMIRDETLNSVQPVSMVLSHMDSSTTLSDPSTSNIYCQNAECDASCDATRRVAIVIGTVFVAVLLCNAASHCLVK